MTYQSFSQYMMISPKCANNQEKQASLTFYMKIIYIYEVYSRNSLGYWIKLSELKTENRDFVLVQCPNECLNPPKSCLNANFCLSWGRKKE